jgi:hypothetical protein
MLPLDIASRQVNLPEAKQAKALHKRLYNERFTKRVLFLIKIDYEFLGSSIEHNSRKVKIKNDFLTLKSMKFGYLEN